MPSNTAIDRMAVANREVRLNQKRRGGIALTRLRSPTNRLKPPGNGQSPVLEMAKQLPL